MRIMSVLNNFIFVHQAESQSHQSIHLFFISLLSFLTRRCVPLSPFPTSLFQTQIDDLTENEINVKHHIKLKIKILMQIKSDSESKTLLSLMCLSFCEYLSNVFMISCYLKCCSLYCSCHLHSGKRQWCQFNRSCARAERNIVHW